MTDYVYVLRCVNEDMTSYNGFRWPTKGYVECPDWDTKPEYGNGLHGFLWGEGALGISGCNDNSKWLVVKVNKADVVDLDGNVKFPHGEVVFCGTNHEAANYIASLGATGRVHFVHREGGDYVDLVGGNYVNLKAGHCSTLTAGYDSTLKAGKHSTLTAGYGSLFTAGLNSVLIGYCMDTGKRVMAMVGQDGIEPDVTYVIKDGKFVPA